MAIIAQNNGLISELMFPLYHKNLKNKKEEVFRCLLRTQKELLN